MKEFKSFFKTVDGNEGTLCHYSTRLDTYGCGCNNNCGYCYAKSLLDFRGLWNPVEPSIADINKIKKIIDKKLKSGDIVRLGGMTYCKKKLHRGCSSLPPSFLQIISSTREFIRDMMHVFSNYEKGLLGTALISLAKISKARMTI